MSLVCVEHAVIDHLYFYVLFSPPSNCRVASYSEMERAATNSQPGPLPVGFLAASGAVPTKQKQTEGRVWGIKDRNTHKKKRK